jgi:cytochrome P450
MVALLFQHSGHTRLTTKQIPGPFLARFSKFYSVFASVLPNYRYFKKTEQMYKRYQADVIRTGPREVTVFCADAIPLIHGPTSRCTKGPWYSAAAIGGTAVQTVRDKEEHKRRRKGWDHSLNTKALREYEPRLNRHAIALMSKLKDRTEDPSVRITDWVMFYSFDVIGDVGFGRSFGMVEKGEEDDIIKLLHAGMEPFSIFGHIMWALNLATRTSAGGKALLDHVDWQYKVLRERVKVKMQDTRSLTSADHVQKPPKERDIVSWLLEPNSTDIPPNVTADARLLAVAGRYVHGLHCYRAATDVDNSDTTSSTLSWICYELCKDPRIQNKLRAEIDAIARAKSFLDVEDVANCAYLDGVINEALRLHPAVIISQTIKVNVLAHASQVPSGVQRETPPEGLTLPNGTYIPGRILMWMPPHCIQRDPRYFFDPLKFLPERWTNEQPEAIIDRRAFFPFSVGPYNCVGQKLAMLEMRSVTANLVRSFDMSFAEGEDGTDIVEMSRDNFSITVGKLDVKLTSR